MSIFCISACSKSKQSNDNEINFNIGSRVHLHVCHRCYFTGHAIIAIKLIQPNPNLISLILSLQLNTTGVLKVQVGNSINQTISRNHKLDEDYSIDERTFETIYLSFLVSIAMTFSFLPNCSVQIKVRKQALKWHSTSSKLSCSDVFVYHHMKWDCPLLEFEMNENRSIDSLPLLSVLASQLKLYQ